MLVSSTALAIHHQYVHGFCVRVISGHGEAFARELEHTDASARIKEANASAGALFGGEHFGNRRLKKGIG
jgi:hypothetical protein